MADLQKLSNDLMTGEAAPAQEAEATQAVEQTEYAGKDLTQMSIDEKKAYAIDQGWKPKDQWKGDTSKWTDFDEFADRHSNIYIRLEKAEKANEKTSEMLARQAELHKKTLERQEARYKKELADKLAELNAQKKQAKDDLDVDKVERLTEEVRQTEQEIKDIDTAPKEDTQRMIQETQRILNDWQLKNPWYGKDLTLTAEADRIAPYIGKMHPDLTPQERLKMVEDEVKRRYPDDFRNKNQDRQPVDYGGERNAAAPRQTYKKFGVNDLEPTDRMLFERYKKNSWGIPKKQQTPERLKESEDKFFEDLREIYEADKRKNKN
jgi:hypothetical protein